MCSVINDFFDEQDIELILQLDAVQFAKERVVDTYSFSIELPHSIQETIFHKLGIHVSTVPMRWIKGDTKPHIDTCNRKFNQTHLVYITDSEGEFILDKDSYPIYKNTAFSFSEGILHKTINTGSEPRLLLGPMSEDGIQVGAAVNITYPGNTTVYIRYVEGYIEYSTDLDSWYSLSFPCSVTNTDTLLGILKIIFINDITINNDNTYFVCQSSHIQFGSTYLNEDGTRRIITIDNVSNYPGLIQNGTESNYGYNYVYVFNLEVSSNNSTLYLSEGPGSGWIGHQYYGKGAIYNYIVNCHSDGDIPALCGGIVGPYSSGFNSSTSLVIIGCSSSGSIDSLGGGIVGRESSYITCKYCWTTGEILANAGGIMGSTSSNVFVYDSYTTGVISGDSAGGIYGPNSTTIYIDNCYTTGNITGNYSGGLVGPYASTLFISNCYTGGNVSGTSSGAICGLNNESPNINITNCYTYGTVSNNGYFNGIDSNNYTVTVTNSYSEAQSGTPGTWNKSNASTALFDIPYSPSIIGNTWVESTLNSPYELIKMGYSPYTIENIKYDIDRTVNLNKLYPVVGYFPSKDMDNNNYTNQIDPYNYQSSLFPDLADFISDNILQGDKSDDNKLIASYWNDLGNDVFNNWGHFYIYDVTTSKYYFPLLSPQNEADSVLITQTFTAFDRTFTIQHGWSIQGVFKIDITVNDSLPFRFGAYGTMGSDGEQDTSDITYTYTLNNESKTLYYRYDIESGDTNERLYSYFIPNNNTDNISTPYSVYYDNDNMSMYTNSITSGITIYFSKTNDVKDFVVNDLKVNAGDENVINYVLKSSESTSSAIISGKSYQILEKKLITYNGSDVTLTVFDDDTITIDSTTGVISTTSSTPMGTYKIYIRNNGSYHISEYNLIINNIIYANGTTDILYFRYNSSTLQYRINDGSYITPPLPINIYNIDTSSVLKVLFETDITITDSSSYFVCMSDKIQFGSTSLNDSGLRQSITIDGVSDYPGLIQNGTSTYNGYNYIYVFNIMMNSLDSNLVEYGGWVGQQYFGKGIDDTATLTTYNYFVNCHTTGNISSNCGGIVGSDCGHYGYVKLLHCSSTGEIEQYAGGIVGPNSGYYASVTCEECWSEGLLTNEGGGIFGKNAGNRGQAIAQRCYSEGNIQYRGGGIFSSFAGASNGSATAIHCYSKGEIGEDAGGIVGCFTADDSGSVTINNCFSGGINNSGSGIVSTLSPGTTISETNTYSSNGVWYKSDANNNLLGIPSSGVIGDIFTETHDGEHYRIHNMGHTPYLQEIINIVNDIPEMVKIHTITLTLGETSIPAISGSGYRILNTTTFVSPSFIRNHATSEQLKITMLNTGAIATEKSINSSFKPMSTSITVYNSGSYHISTITLTIEPSSNVPICFPAGTPVLTDQGEIPIEMIDPKKHTIDSKPIVAITKTVPLYPYVICIEKNSLGDHLPSRRTFISKDHKVLYQQKLIPSEQLPNAIKVNYSGQVLYNVLLKDYSTMKVNGLTVETLHPNNTLAKIYTGKFTPEQKRKLIASSNKLNLQQRKSQVIKSNFLQIIYQ
jgi:hypothetical protein